MVRGREERRIVRMAGDKVLEVLGFFPADKEFGEVWDSLRSSKLGRKDCVEDRPREQSLRGTKNARTTDPSFVSRRKRFLERDTRPSTQTPCRPGTLSRTRARSYHLYSTLLVSREGYHGTLGKDSHIVSNNVYPPAIRHDLPHQLPQISGHDFFTESPLCLDMGLRTLSRASVVRCEDMIACVCEWRDDVAELVGCLGKAVDEEDGSFGGGFLGRRAGDAGDVEVGVGIIGGVEGGWR